MSLSSWLEEQQLDVAYADSLGKAGIEDVHALREFFHGNADPMANLQKVGVPDNEIGRICKAALHVADAPTGDVALSSGAPALTGGYSSGAQHRFEFSAAWGQALTARVPKFARRTDSLIANLVRENDSVVKDGKFDSVQGVQEIPPPPPTNRIRCPEAPHESAMKFDVTQLCVANIDTLSAALLVGDATALNFANAHTPGGGYRHGARAQEEDLCRLLPQLIHSLEACHYYPIAPHEVLLTKNLAAVREPGTYKLCPSLGAVNILTSAMPNDDCGRPGGDQWNKTVRLRMRAVLHAAKLSGFPNIVLGAWGCGAFGNPPGLVAELFREQLCSLEFRGSFKQVVFAVVDPKRDGNFKPFEGEISKMHGL